MAAIELYKTPVEDICEKLSNIYEKVDLAHEPNIRWVQIVNDTTMLAEEVRRNRTAAAVERSGKILMRLLEFVGYYTYTYRIVRKRHDEIRFRDFTGLAFQSPSLVSCYGRRAPKEGITRWVLGKYPHACAKCGNQPCRCLVEPWVFEERRENPAPFDRYRKLVDNKRKKLKQPWRDDYFTLPNLFKFFNRIYRNTRYNQEPWKLAMHLVEELGEATIALSRIELAYVGFHDRFKLSPHLADIKKQVAEGKIDKQTEKIKDTQLRDEIRLASKRELEKLIKDLRRREPWQQLVKMVSERLKEEIADVLSWLMAVIYKLRDDNEKAVLEDLENRIKHYIGPTGFLSGLRCPWCNREKCADDCLVRHGLASELAEKALKF